MLCIKYFFHINLLKIDLIYDGTKKNHSKEWLKYIKKSSRINSDSRKECIDF